MLEALMLRQIMMLDNNRVVTKATAEERETVHQKFKTYYLDDAIRFVNGRKGSDLRETLQTYSSLSLDWMTLQWCAGVAAILVLKKRGIYHSSTC